MNTTYIIRNMTEADIPQAAALEAETFSEPWTERGFADAIRQKTNIFLVAEEDGDIVGYCGLYTFADEADISNIAVAAKCRRRGIANQLITKIKELAYSQGVRQIFLEVRQSNTPAQSLYIKHGFDSCGIRHDFYRMPTEDALMMLCKL
ncbi:MAG: ribosomal protein S18-alanine N-acetyltransferase [Clostridiales bacterium]|nr:ribosomal protein S18-alanine N-acetyltransferase [Clostridiales bacterium]